jgi:hypothetical protein
MRPLKIAICVLLFSVGIMLPHTRAYGIVPDCVNDKIKPICGLYGMGDGTVTVLTADTNGICKIEAPDRNNISDISPTFSRQPANANTVELVTATKRDKSKKASFTLVITDCCGNVTTCDPILTSVLRRRGTPTADTFFDIPKEEGFITVKNGTPGLSRITVIVNGKKFQTPILADGDEVTLDVSTAMERGFQNMMSVVGYGKAGGRASILIWDGGQK